MHQRCLLEGGNGAGRRGGFGDGAVDLVPDDVVGFIAEDGYQERLDAVKVEVVRVDGSK